MGTKKNPFPIILIKVREHDGNKERVWQIKDHEHFGWILKTDVNGNTIYGACTGDPMYKQYKLKKGSPDSPDPEQPVLRYGTHVVSSAPEINLQKWSDIFEYCLVKNNTEANERIEVPTGCPGKPDPIQQTTLPPKPPESILKRSRRVTRFTPEATPATDSSPQTGRSSTDTPHKPLPKPPESKSGYIFLK